MNTIAQELSFNEFEAVAFYMFMKKVGWFSEFKMVKHADSFKAILEHPPRYAN